MLRVLGSLRVLRALRSASSVVPLVLALVGCGSSAPPSRAPASPAPAKIVDVVDTVHGVAVHDPYRWMEQGGAALDAFLDEQDAHARRSIAAIPGLAQLRASIRDANRGTARIGIAAVRGSYAAPRVFLWKRGTDDITSQLWVREGWDGADTQADWFKNSATYLHVLGDDPERAQPVFSPLMKELGLAPECYSSIVVSPRSKWALALADPGTSSDKQYFVAPVASVVPGKTPWRRLTGPGDGVEYVGARGDTLYAHSYAGAARYRVLAMDARTGTLATARVVVPEDPAILQDFLLADDAMYLQYFDGGKSRIERLRYEGGARAVVKLPYDGAASIYGQADRPGMLLSLLVTGGRRDVRVPIWQQAKFVARAQAVSRSGKPILLRVEREGGHFGASEADEDAEWVDVYAFALWQSGVTTGK